MRALFGFTPAVFLAMVGASCPAPSEALLHGAHPERAQASAGEFVKAFGKRVAAKPTGDDAAIANEAATNGAHAAVGAVADDDPDSPAAWGVDEGGPIDPTLAEDEPSPSDPASPPDGRAGGLVRDAAGHLARMLGGPDPDRDPDGPVIVSIAKETWVFDKPKWRSKRIGYLRAGSMVSRDEEAAGNSSCKAGWYAVKPRGFVCGDGAASLDRDHPVAVASRVKPKMDGLPYDYVISRIPGPPMYARVPTESQQREFETDLGFHVRQAKALEHDPAFVPLPEPQAMPDILAGDALIPGLTDEAPRSPAQVLVGQAHPRAGFALLSQFESNGRRFGLTTQLFVVPLDRTRFVAGSKFHGIALGELAADGPAHEEVKLPVAFVMKHKATRYQGEDMGQKTAGAALDYREAVPLTGRTSHDGQYYEATDGSWVRIDAVRRIDPLHRAPAWAEKGRRWIDVSILKQSMVVYEGTKPVYVTLVSTGADGLGDPKKTHSTIQGTFLIHTKHVSVTMDNDEKNEEFDLRDVPFVQYFTQGYALHAAYWHDDFGTPRSHGCVNLAPIDAAWLFGFTTPEVPKGWHAAMSLKHGTLVYTHP